jgi:hypothetical protein
MEQTVGHILDLQWLWNTLSDEKLIYYCREYPGLYRYGTLMEEAAIAESKKAKTSYGHLPEFPGRPGVPAGPAARAPVPA